VGQQNNNIADELVHPEAIEADRQKQVPDKTAGGKKDWQLWEAMVEV
jgi:hypothetical protein